jgi:hypothetical protein
MLAYIGCNTDDFDKSSNCLKAVKKTLDESNWKADYSRRLIATNPSFSDLVAYFDGLTQMRGRILYLDILNRRPDTAASDTTARLKNYRKSGAKNWMPSEIRSPLKATRVRGYSHTILPNSSEAFDLLCIGESSDAAGETKAFLNCALDLLPKPCIPITCGVWELECEFYAIGFPVLTVVVEVSWSDNGRLAAKILRQDNS